MASINASAVSMILAAGGASERFGNGTLKQLKELNGIPVFLHSVITFRKAFPDGGIVVAAPGKHLEEFENELAKASTHDVILCEGGDTRASSIESGLSLLSDHAELILVHDAARPLASVALFQRVAQETNIHGTAIPFIPVQDSIRQKIDEYTRPVNRSNYTLIQTPQGFKTSVLKKSYAISKNRDFTDCASLVESNGFPLFFVKGENFNSKLTVPEDLKLAEAYLKI